jgi:hypothetical protein
MMQPASDTAPAAVLEMTGSEDRLTSCLRPGVTFPDWSVVTSATAHGALVAMLEAGWNRRAWQGYTPAEDAVRHAILELYRDFGRAPSPEEIAHRADTGPDQVRLLLKRLAARDLIVLEDDEIIGAYPLTDRPSEHRVMIADRKLHAMCAIDALGVGAMFRTDATIESRCRLCHRLIAIATGDAGRSLTIVSPIGAMSFAATGYRGNCAATSLCTTIAFFCSDAHLSAWRSSQSFEGPTFRLSIGEALEVGRAIFGLVLKAPQDQPEVYR